MRSVLRGWEGVSLTSSERYGNGEVGGVGEGTYMLRGRER